MNPTPPHLTSALGAAALGMGCAVVIGALALIMSGGGHGWNSSAVSNTGLVLIPLAAVAWLFRFRRRGRALAFGMLVGAALTDAFLISQTNAEGWYFVGRVWETSPVLLLVWSILWIGWQVAMVCAVCARRRH